MTCWNKAKEHTHPFQYNVVWIPRFFSELPLNDINFYTRYL